MKRIAPLSAVLVSMLSASWYDNYTSMTAEQVWAAVQAENNKTDANNSSKTKTKVSIVLNNVTEANTPAAKSSLQKLNTIITATPEAMRSKDFIHTVFQKVQGIYRR